MAKNFWNVRNGLSFPGLAAAPSDPHNGDLYYDTALGKFQVYQNGTWGAMGGSSGGNGQFNNYLTGLNPDAENGSTSNWTNSGGTLTATNTNPSDGSYSFQFVASATSQSVSSSAVAIPQGGYGKPGLIRMSYSTSNTDFVLQAYDGTNIIAQITLPATTGYQYGSVTFLIPSSGNIQVRIVSASAGTIKFDDVYLGENFQISQVSQAQWIGNLRFDGNGASSCNFPATGASFSDPAGVNCNAPVITGQLTSPGNVFQASLPTAEAAVYRVVVQGSVVVGANQSSTCRIIDDLGNVLGTQTAIAGTGGQYAPMTIDGSFAYTSPGSRTWKAQCQYNGGGAGFYAYNDSGRAMSMSFTVYKYPSQSQTAVTVDTTAISWSGFHNGAGVNYWQTASTSYADPTTTGSPITLTERFNSNFGTVTTAAGGLPGITFTPRKAGNYLVCANLSTDASGTRAYYKLTDGTTSFATAVASAFVVSAPLCGIYSINQAGTPVTVKVQVATNSGGTGFIYTDNAISNLIEWSILNISQNAPSPVVISGPRSYFTLNTANGYGATNTVIRRFTNTVENVGTAMTVADSSTLGTTVTINSEGIYAFTWCDSFSGAGTVGLTVNTATPSTSIYSTAVAERRFLAESNAAGQATCGTWIGHLNAGDIVRPHGDGTSTSGDSLRTTFTGAKVSN